MKADPDYILKIIYVGETKSAPTYLDSLLMIVIPVFSSLSMFVNKYQAVFFIFWGAVNIWGRVPGAGGARVQVLGWQLGLEPNLPVLCLLLGKQCSARLCGFTLWEVRKSLKPVLRVRLGFIAYSDPPF